MTLLKDVLAPAVLLVFDHHMPYGVADHWKYWIEEKRRELPESPPARGEGRMTSDGSEIAMQARIVALDSIGTANHPGDEGRTKAARPHEGSIWITLARIDRMGEQ